MGATGRATGRQNGGAGRPRLPSTHGPGGMSTMRIPAMRGLGLGVAAVLMLAGTVTAASAATSYTASLGSHGGARWTVGTSVYVNLKAMTPGTWNQQLWSGTCAPTVRHRRPSEPRGSAFRRPRTTSRRRPGCAVAVPSTGIVLRLLQGTTVVCGVFRSRGRGCPRQPRSTA